MTIGILGILTMKGIFAYSFWVSIHVWDYEFDHHERAGSQIRKSGINRLRLRRRRRRPINCWKCPSCLLHTLVSELKMKRWSFCLPQVWLYESKTEKRVSFAVLIQAISRRSPWTKSNCHYIKTPWFLGFEYSVDSRYCGVFSCVEWKMSAWLRLEFISHYLYMYMERNCISNCVRVSRSRVTEWSNMRLRQTLILKFK